MTHLENIIITCRSLKYISSCLYVFHTKSFFCENNYFVTVAYLEPIQTNI